MPNFETFNEFSDARKKFPDSYIHCSEKYVDKSGLPFKEGSSQGIKYKLYTVKSPYSRIDRIIRGAGAIFLSLITGGLIYTNESGKNFCNKLFTKKNEKFKVGVEAKASSLSQQILTEEKEETAVQKEPSNKSQLEKEIETQEQPILSAEEVLDKIKEIKKAVLSRKHNNSEIIVQINSLLKHNGPISVINYTNLLKALIILHAKEGIYAPILIDVLKETEKRFSITDTATALISDITIFIEAYNSNKAQLEKMDSYHFILDVRLESLFKDIQ